MVTENIDIISGDREKGIKKAAGILKSGGIVAIPTETVYGLAASALDGEAIKKVFIAKGRPQDNPLIVHISDFSMLDGICECVPESAKVLAERFWPGPLTMVLKRKDTIADEVSAGLDTVAVRMPASDTAREIIKEANLPLAAPSANVSGAPSPTTAQHVLSDLDGKIDAIVFGEDCTVGVESTVISLIANPPRLLRPGAVTAEQLREFLPDLIIDKAVLSEPEKGQRVLSPGMLYRHYAPKTETVLIEADTEKFTAFVNKQKNCAVICFFEDEKDCAVKKLCYGKKDDASEQAKNIFSCLRQVDGLNAETVYIHAPQKSGVGLAVYNRLLRAAAFKVIKL